MADIARPQPRIPALGAALGMALPLLILLPSLVFYAGLASSLALGSSLAAIVLLLIAIAVRATRHALAPFWGGWSLVVLVAVTAHAVIAMLFQPFEPLRAALSAAPLVLMVMAGFALAGMLAFADRATVDRVVSACLVLLGAAALVSILGFTPETTIGERVYDKPVFPFTEPSHFALVFTPLIMHRCVATTGYRRVLALLLGVAVAAWLQNLTLFVGMLLVGCICLRGVVLPFVAILMALAVAGSDMSYYLERLDFSGDVQNLSNLVYVQGWQLIGESLERSSGWGLGFQQLGLQGGSTPAGDVIVALLGENANLLDGGFTLSKLVSEFGVWGMALAGLYLLGARSAILFLRSAACSPQDHAAPTILAQSMIAAYSIELLVRGAGYFTGTGILLVASVVLVYGRYRARISAGHPTRSARAAHPNVRLSPSHKATP